MPENCLHGIGPRQRLSLWLKRELRQSSVQQVQHWTAYVSSSHIWGRPENRSLQSASNYAETLMSSLLYADLAEHCSIIFTMLVDDRAVRSVVQDILRANPAQGTIIVECSTIYPGLTQELESQAQDQGCHLLSCPVFGRPDAVKEGNALFVCAGDPKAKREVSSQARHICILQFYHTWCTGSLPVEAEVLLVIRRVGLPLSSLMAGTRCLVVLKGGVEELQISLRPP